MVLLKQLEVDIAQISLTCDLVKTYSHELSSAVRDNHERTANNKLSDLKKQIRELNNQMKALETKAEYLNSLM